MVLSKEELDSLTERCKAITREGGQFLDRVVPKKEVDDSSWPPKEYWLVDDPESIREANGLRDGIRALCVKIAGAARGSPLFAEADMQDLRLNMRQMMANLRFGIFRHAGVYIHHHEDIVLGVDPPSNEEVAAPNEAAAKKAFQDAGAKILDLIGILSPSDETRSPPADTSNYRPNSAFVMMAIDPDNPELEDVRNVIKDVFDEFGIQAITADEIEHEDVITNRILSEIESSEFLMADLTYERPNVYYEIGHAHAKNKRVILYRKKETKLHFDIAHRNCPEYRNTTDLKKLLRRRLENITNKRSPVGIQ